LNQTIFDKKEINTKTKLQVIEQWWNLVCYMEAKAGLLEVKK
jgi:hypothetical protein